MFVSFILVLILAIVVGIIVHFVLSWFWPSTCNVCEVVENSADIWENLEEVDKEMPHSTTSATSKNIEDVASDLLDDDDDDI
jgi:hypothetical protein